MLKQKSVIKFRSKNTKTPGMGKNFYLAKLSKKNTLPHRQSKFFTQNKISFSPLRNYFFYLKFVLVAGLFLSWIALMLFLPYFQITRVSYDGLKIISPGEIDALLEKKIFKPRRFLPVKNYFLLNSGTIKEALDTHFSLSFSEVKKIFPNKISISLREKNSSLIYDNGDQYFLLDESGTATRYLAEVEEDEFITQKIPLPATPFSTVSSTFPYVDASSTMLLSPTNTPILPPLSVTSSTTSTLATSSLATAFTIQRQHVPRYTKFRNTPDFNDLIVVYDSRQLSVKELQAHILPPAVIKAIIDCKDMLYNSHLARVQYFIFHNDQDVEAITEEKFRILFNINMDINAENASLRAVLKENKPKEYIDLRYDGRVYWK